MESVNTRNELLTEIIREIKKCEEIINVLIPYSHDMANLDLFEHFWTNENQLLGLKMLLLRVSSVYIRNAPIAIEDETSLFWIEVPKQYVFSHMTPFINTSHVYSFDGLINICPDEILVYLPNVSCKKRIHVRFLH